MWSWSSARVERSLYERANGYNFETVKVFMPAGAKQPVVVHYVEHCPPDVGAAFIWLKNRDPERWRDSQQIEHVAGKYIISGHQLTEEEWARERATVIDANQPMTRSVIALTSIGSVRRTRDAFVFDRILLKFGVGK